MEDSKQRDEPRYTLRVRNKFDNGGVLSVMDGLDKTSNDYNDIMAIGRKFAESGNTVQILGTIHYKNEYYDKFFDLLKDTEYFKKCPDLKVGFKFYEYEGFVGTWSKKKLGRMLSHGAKQSPYIIIKNTKGCTDRFIIKCIHDRLKDKAFTHPIMEVWAYEKGNIRLVYKKR